MTHALSILLADTDNYFTYGLRLGLQTFFQSRHQEVHLFENEHTLNNVDIIFLGNSTTCPPWLYRLHQKKCYPLVFFIKDERRYRNTDIHRTMCDKCGVGTFYRHQDIFALLRLLDKVLSPPVMPSASPYRHCQCLRMSLLTPREVDVLQYLTLGMNGRGIATRLHISDKTVNAHKQNAMRKLNFKRNQELYHWLLQGGTRYLRESPPDIAELNPISAAYA
ncbi:helix-turn-helix transcriptional regulator [Chania multitudinisentens]|uniref:helix-turn-helix transcriptional regulator n=1 Tax=Chania multitudinisentens TaxID=1639108 RepID=UPI000467057E|nr:LuxR C-terminal-related transcriptional regulator [Chania multitudinisentens]